MHALALGPLLLGALLPAPFFSPRYLTPALARAPPASARARATELEHGDRDFHLFHDPTRGDRSVVHNNEGHNSEVHNSEVHNSEVPNSEVHNGDVHNGGVQSNETHGSNKRADLVGQRLGHGSFSGDSLRPVTPAESLSRSQNQTSYCGEYMKLDILFLVESTKYMPRAALSPAGSLTGDQRGPSGGAKGATASLLAKQLVWLVENLKFELLSPRTQVGVATFKDWPAAPYGDAFDVPYSPVLPLTSGVFSDPGLIAHAIDHEIWYHGGGDFANNQLGAIPSALLDPRLNWTAFDVFLRRPLTHRLVVLLTSTVPHATHDPDPPPEQRLPTLPTPPPENAKPGAQEQHQEKQRQDKAQQGKEQQEKEQQEQEKLAGGEHKAKELDTKENQDKEQEQNKEMLDKQEAEIEKQYKEQIEILEVAKQQKEKLYMHKLDREKLAHEKLAETTLDKEKLEKGETAKEELKKDKQSAEKGQKGAQETKKRLLLDASERASAAPPLGSAKRGLVTDAVQRIQREVPPAKRPPIVASHPPYPSLGAVRDSLRAHHSQLAVVLINSEENQKVATLLDNSWRGLGARLGDGGEGGDASSKTYHFFSASPSLKGLGQALQSIIQPLITCS